MKTRTRSRIGHKRNRRTTSRATAPSAFAMALRRVLPWTLFTVALGGTAVGLYSGWHCLHDTERLQIASIEVLGAERTTWEEIQVYTGIRAGDPILAVDLDAAALQLRRHPWVARATVRRRIPDKVTIEIVEHTPEILVSLGEVYLANAEGKLFKRVAARDGVVLPVLTGIDAEDAARDTARTEETIRDGIALRAAWPRSGDLRAFEELHYDHDLGWSVITRLPSGKMLRLHLGRDPVSRIALAEAALKRLRALDREPAALWVDGTKTPSRVMVRFGQTRKPGAVALPKPLIAKAGD